MNIIYVICIPQYTKLSYMKLRKTKGYIMVTPSFSLTKNNQGVCNAHEILSCHTTILGVDHTSPYNPLLSNYASDHMVNSYGLTFLFLWGLDCGHVEKYWEYFDPPPPHHTQKNTWCKAIWGNKSYIRRYLCNISTALDIHWIKETMFGEEYINTVRNFGIVSMSISDFARGT